MAEIAAGFLGPAIEVVKYVAAPVKRQFTYLCCFNSNIKSLRDEAQNLDDAEKGLQMKVDRARDDVQVIVPEVETWLTKSKDIKEQLKGILDEVPNVGSGLKLSARFSLSKKAKKTIDLMKELRGQCQFNTISLQGPPAATKGVLLGTTFEFESRREVEEDIMTTLKKKDVNMIGLCGMGGVGKTTMAKRIMTRVLEEHLFDEAVMVVISQQVDKLKIQLDIGGSLGLKLEGEVAQARVHKLHTRLSGTRRILLVLDDVWGSLVLEDLGIPCCFKGCTILLTSRNRDVLRAMNVEKVCGLQILSEGEAWFLFREKSGTCVDDTGLNSTAVEVVKECKGLPIALAAVGVALRDEKDISIWKDALRQLRKSNPLDIPNIITDVYNPLKLSYDFLDRDEHAKSTFLLCFLFPEDDDIPLDHLTYFAMGLHVLEGIWDLEEARGRMRALIKMLKNRFLLLDGSDEDHVRMHDVVRDVSIYVASAERRINCNDCTWISSFVGGRPRLPAELGFPNLHLLFLDNRVEQEFQIDDNFIECTRELNVLFIRYGLLRSLPSLPHTTQLLKCLGTLVLDNCESLETISVVGQFVNLEILICRSCDRLKEVPLEVRGLKRLKLLEIWRCPNLKRVAPGVISSLVGLEELKIYGFNEWEADVEGKEKKNAGLRELESLTNLRSLMIDVSDSTLAAAPLLLSPKLLKFSVEFGAFFNGPLSPKIYCKKLFLDFSYENIGFGDFSTNMFLRNTEYLFARGNGTTINWDLANARSIRWLTVESFENMKNITASTAGFPLLEFLSLEYLDNLEEIWDGPVSSNSFKNLKELRLEWLPALRQLGKSSYHNNVIPLFSNLSSIFISRCGRLRYLFSSATVNDCLPQLEKMKIEHCGVMEQVVLLNQEDKSTRQGSHMTIFPKLKSLHLHDLPMLTSFCKGIESIEFPLLSKINIQQCQHMNYFAYLGEGINLEHYHDHDYFHMFCQPKVSFGNMRKLKLCPIHENNSWCDQVPIGFFSGLEEIDIGNYFNTRSLFSSSTAENLVNLRKLKITYSFEMVTVIEGNGEGKDRRGGTITRRLFPRLQEICLEGVHKLKYFCDWKCALELPSLKKLRIYFCREMTSFSLGPLITPALEEIVVDGRELSSIEDVNAALQQHFSQPEPQESTWEERDRVRHCWRALNSIELL